MDRRKKIDIEKYGKKIDEIAENLAKIIKSKRGGYISVKPGKLNRNRRVAGEVLHLLSENKIMEVWTRSRNNNRVIYAIPEEIVIDGEKILNPLYHIPKNNDLRHAKKEIKRIIELSINGNIISVIKEKDRNRIRITIE